MTTSRKVLMVSPHFPPDSSAASHRVRLLAPYLDEHGWEPTVVTVEPGDYEARRDDGLLTMVPESLNIVRVRAWSAGCVAADKAIVQWVQVPPCQLPASGT